jgi:GT2 family glycosyltransferase
MPNTLTLGVLTRGVVSTDWAFSLRGLSLPADTSFVKLPGLPFHHARNEIARKALKSESTWLLFLDDDVLPPKDTYLQLSAWMKPIVSGLYWKRQGKIVCTAYQETKGVPAPVHPDKPQEVDLVGGGCLLIHSSVLQNVPYPWFEWTVDNESLDPRDRLGEDFNFCRKARKHGFQIFLDTLVKCRHEGQGWSDENGKFVPPPALEL